MVFQLHCPAAAASIWHLYYIGCAYSSLFAQYCLLNSASIYFVIFLYHDHGLQIKTQLANYNDHDI